ncbi:MAG: DUF1638 domain-containing protein [Planctomycetota bacterium]
MDSSIKRVHVIACGVLAIDLKAVAARTGLDVSMEFLPGGLHNTPGELRRRLQEAVDAASARSAADLIAVGYGVCGLGAVGISARNIPLAIPRVHDCIALFLGSDSAYREQFAKCPGTYYISAGWVQERSGPHSAGASGECDGKKPDVEADDLIARHGAQNAEVIRHFLSSWQRNYRRAVFIDTGASDKSRYAEVAQEMAREFGWGYEQLPGSPRLLEKLLKQRVTTDEILIVPPHHVTAYDALSKGLKAVPVWGKDSPGPGRRRTVVLPGKGEEPPPGEPLRRGLGIDAGGTYTDVAVFDFTAAKVLAKAKALTTKWDFTIGIGEALDALDPALLADIDMVSISTTLATNAIVEGRGQTVGLLIMPPYGLFDGADIEHRPLAVIDGRMEIDGRELSPIDEAQIERTAAEMIERQGVGAFAVTGYASHVNPAHELAVKAILRRCTHMTVTCGHEVSEGLNYRIRAATAALNARIIPCLESFLAHVEQSLSDRGVRAPRMVVRSDGSLMNVATARSRPIETILSGPAASVAGARYLAGVADAIVVDIGGTTTDTAIIARGHVRTCPDGSSVGGWRTHVKALDMRTLGLGGDSEIVIHRGQRRIGPRRVGAVCWLARRHDGLAHVLDWIERHLDYYTVSTGGMDVLALNAVHDGLAADEDEKRIIEALADGPLSAHELAQRVDKIRWEFLPLARLEETHTIQRCALTPTDLLHVTGQLAMWDAHAARRMTGLFGQLVGLDPDQFARATLDQFEKTLALEVLKKQLDETVDADGLDRSPAAGAMVENLLSGGSDGFHVRVKLTRPLVGIGAPAHFFLPAAARLLETQAIVPPHADVANAVGAITSSVSVHRQAEISPNEVGRYKIEGLLNAPTFAELEEAYQYAMAQLEGEVRQAARLAGTSERTVEVTVADRVAGIADGSELFIGRRLDARITGRPDIRLATGD